jgi:hypothetical protein
MSYIVATTEDRVRWYEFDLNAGTVVALHEVLDLNRVSRFHDKDSAKVAAKNAGLKTWRYGRLS